MDVLQYMPVDTQIGVVVTHMLHQQRNTGRGTALKGGEEEGKGGERPFISEDTTDSYFSITQ